MASLIPARGDSPARIVDSASPGRGRTGSERHISVIRTRITFAGQNYGAKPSEIIIFVNYTTGQ